MRITLVTLLLAAWSVAAPASAPAQLSGPIPNGRIVEGTLSFDGHATAGDFVGTTSAVSGEMLGGDSLAAVRGWVEAPAQTLLTGNGRRDRDLRKSLESDKHPAIRFDLEGVSPAGEAGGDSLTVTLRGGMAIHGVTRQVSLPGVVRLIGTEVKVRSDFPLNLKDYEIGGLSKMLGMLRMYEQIEVHVDLTFAPEQESEK